MKFQEHTEQVKFIQRCRWLKPDLLAYAIPNGGKRNPKEAVRLKAEGVLSGIPDVCIAHPTSWYHGLYLEFKTAKGRTSQNQQDVIAQLRANGYRVDVVRSCEEAWQVLEEYLEDVA